MFLPVTLENHPMKILLVDDEESITKALSIMLAHMGHAVETSNAAETAARMIESGEYDFVLIDYKMPVKDGTWFMKNAKIPRTTKVLLLTAYVNRQMINDMFRLGVCGYLIKPVDVEELGQHISFHASNAARRSGRIDLNDGNRPAGETKP